MPMTETEAKALVDLLARAYPTYPATSETRELYVQALQNDRHGAPVVAAAVRTWIVNESWMPKVNELLDAVKVEAAQRRAEDSDRLRGARALPPGTQPTAVPSHVRQRIMILQQVRREMWLTVEQRASMSVDDRTKYQERFAARVDGLLAEHPELVAVDEFETFVCPQCLDTGWIRESVLDDDPTAPVRPCPCHPELYDRWKAGHFEPGHSCAACDALRRGRRSA